MTLVAHRCPRHRSVSPINQDADTVLVYAPDSRPRALAIQGAAEGSVRAECGGCLAEQVDVLWMLHLDLLDLAADALTGRALVREAMREVLREIRPDPPPPTATR
jgi:hypothetical protein